MCLYTNNVVPEKLKRGKTVYKVLYKCFDNYLSPYMNYHLPVGKLVKDDNAVKFYNNTETDFGPEYSFVITSGGFHSYLEKKSADDLCLKLKDYIKHKCQKIVVCECWIPQGTECYIGRDAFNKSIMSKRIKIVKEL